MATLEELRLQLRAGALDAKLQAPHVLQLDSRHLYQWIECNAVGNGTFVAKPHQVEGWKLREHKTIFIDNVEYFVREIQRHCFNGVMDANFGVTVALLTSAEAASLA